MVSERNPKAGVRIAALAFLLSAAALALALAEKPSVVTALLCVLVPLCAVVLTSAFHGARRFAAGMAERAEHELRLRQLGDNLPGSYIYEYQHDLDGRPRFTYLSAGVEAVHGFSAAEIVAQHDLIEFSVEPAAQVELVRLERESAAAMTDFEMDMPFVRRDGEARLLNARSRPRRLADGRVVWDGVATDVTAAREMERTLRTSNERIRRHAEALKSLTRGALGGGAGLQELLATAHDVLALTSASAWRFDESGLGMTCHGVEPAAAEPGARERRRETPELLRWRDALATGEALEVADAQGDVRLEGLRRLGALDTAVQRALHVPIHLGGQVAGVLRLERASAQGPFLPDERTLALALGHLVVLLWAEEARVAVEERLRQTQKMEAIGQLAGGVAHGFNNILAAMMMQIDLIAAMPSLPPEAKEGLSELSTSARRAADVTRQLLLFGQRQRVQLRPTDVNAAAAALARMLERLLGERVRLELALGSLPMCAMADPGLLDQVMMNLVLNARDSMPGGGLVTLRTEAVTLSAGRAYGELSIGPGRYVRLDVEDLGGGIAPADLPHLFEPYFTTKGLGEASGLGLATVYGITRLHGGLVEVAPAGPGRPGTRFSIHLPATDAPPEARISSAPPPGVSDTPVTILVVEDEAPVRSIVRRALTRHGYRVLEAADGREAVDLFALHAAEIGVLLTDLVMPGGLGGLELAARLQAVRPELRVIYMSGYSVEVGRGELRVKPDERFLAKPFGPAPLLRALREVLGAEAT